jgi:glucose/arabinose dehydrogenase
MGVIRSLHLREAVAALAGVAACGVSPEPIQPPIVPPAADTPVLTREVVIGGLNAPWDVAVASDGSIFFTERCRGLSVRHPDGSITRLFGTNGSALVAPDLHCEGQSGMNGVALDPTFAASRVMYVYMTSTASSPTSNHVIRLTVSAGYTSASGRTDIITDIAFKHTANTVAQGAGQHSGGRIRFGPDGHLYVTTGDNHSGTIPQSSTVLGGKVLRVTTTGGAAPGNAPPAGFDGRIYTYGHRNVQGITFRPGTGQPFISEHGPNHSDEVTPLVNGGNGGWDPQNRSGLICPSSYCGYAGNPSTMPMTDLTRFPNAMPPIWTSQNVSNGMGPAVFLVGTLWRAGDGRLAVGFLRGQHLLIL